MYELILLNVEYNKEFRLDFESPYLMNDYLKKIKYSNKIKLLGKIKKY